MSAFNDDAHASFGGAAFRRGSSLGHHTLPFLQSTPIPPPLIHSSHDEELSWPAYVAYATSRSRSTNALSVSSDSTFAVALQTNSANTSKAVRSPVTSRTKLLMKRTKRKGPTNLSLRQKIDLEPYSASPSSISLVSRRTKNFSGCCHATHR
jgi:hypothetical protein